AGDEGEDGRPVRRVAQAGERERGVDGLPVELGEGMPVDAAATLLPGASSRRAAAAEGLHGRAGRQLQGAEGGGRNQRDEPPVGEGPRRRPPRLAKAPEGGDALELEGEGGERQLVEGAAPGL